MADRSPPRVHSACPRREQHTKSFPLTPLSGLGKVLAGQRLACSTNRIQLVSLGSVAAGRPRRPVDLNDLLALRRQSAG
jgi:hypothetical protein